MKCRRSYQRADFENFSPDTLKIAYCTISVNKGYDGCAAFKFSLKQHTLHVFCVLIKMCISKD